VQSKISQESDVRLVQSHQPPQLKLAKKRQFKLFFLISLLRSSLTPGNHVLDPLRFSEANAKPRRKRRGKRNKKKSKEYSCREKLTCASPSRSGWGINYVPNAQQVEESDSKLLKLRGKNQVERASSRVTLTSPTAIMQLDSSSSSASSSEEEAQRKHWREFESLGRKT